jgi:hypothetical protein
MSKKMNNLPDGMIPDRDNQVYYDTEKCQFYIIKWEDGGNNDYPIRYYIPNDIPHICKYCGVETTQSDDECYKRP